MGKSDFSDIRTYAELEASIRMLRREIDANQLSRQVSYFRETGTPRWTDLALFAIRALRRAIH